MVYSVFPPLALRAAFVSNSPFSHPNQIPRLCMSAILQPSISTLCAYPVVLP